MNRLKNADVLVTDGSTGIGLDPPPRMVGRVPKVGLPRTPPKSHTLSKTHRSQKRPGFDNIVLLLQGGGALGAYQGGVYQALAEANLDPDWVAGISIGSINAAIIAGNPPNLRVEKLRQFWEGITTSPSLNVMGGELDSLARGDSARSFLFSSSGSSSSSVASMFRSLLTCLK